MPSWWLRGYTHPAFSAAGGNPYGTAHPSGNGHPTEEAMEAARRQGERLARITARFVATPDATAS